MLAHGAIRAYLTILFRKGVGVFGQFLIGGGQIPLNPPSEYILYAHTSNNCSTVTPSESRNSTPEESL